MQQSDVTLRALLTVERARRAASLSRHARGCTDYEQLAERELRAAANSNDATSKKAHLNRAAVFALLSEQQRAA